MNRQQEKAYWSKKITPLVKEEGLEVFDLDIVSGAQGVTLRILVDFAEGGVSLAECTNLNRKIYLYLEQDENWKDEYNLEVSSPGVLKKYKHPRDLQRVKGRLLSVQALEAGKIKDYQGICQGIENEKELKLEVKGEVLKIPLKAIKNAKEKI